MMASGECPVADAPTCRAQTQPKPAEPEDVGMNLSLADDAQAAPGVDTLMCSGRAHTQSQEVSRQRTRVASWRSSTKHLGRELGVALGNKIYCQ